MLFRAPVESEERVLQVHNGRASVEKKMVTATSNQLQAEQRKDRELETIIGFLTKKSYRMQRKPELF